MKGMFLKKCDIYYQKCATAAQRFQLSMTKLGACDEIRWNDGTVLLDGGRNRIRILVAQKHMDPDPQHCISEIQYRHFT